MMQIPSGKSLWLFLNYPLKFNEFGSAKVILFQIKVSLEKLRKLLQHNLVLRAIFEK